jgi:hypothetical protein
LSMSASSSSFLIDIIGVVGLDCEVFITSGIFHAYCIVSGTFDS